MAKQNQEDKIKTRGIGLKLSEWEEVDKIADELEITPHAVVAYGVRYFLKTYQEGRIKMQTKKSLPEL